MIMGKTILTKKGQTMKLKTKKDYVQNHRKMWNEIISIFKKSRTKQYNTVTDIKTDAFSKLWPKEHIINRCFGCEWSKLTDPNPAHRAPDCKKCLFKVEYKKGCLNGLYNDFDEAYANWSQDTSKPNEIKVLSVAKQIRDFPVK